MAVVVSGSVMVFVLSDVNIRSRAIGNIAADCRHPASPNTAHGPPRPDHSLMSGDVRGPGGSGARRPGMWSVAIISCIIQPDIGKYVWQSVRGRGYIVLLYTGHCTLCQRLGQCNLS